MISTTTRTPRFRLCEPWTQEIPLTFAFYSPIVRGGRGNGRRQARRLHCRKGSLESAAARLKFRAVSGVRGQLARSSLYSGSRRIRRLCSETVVASQLPYTSLYG